MVSPNKNILNLFSNFTLCDDITNSYEINLIEEDDLIGLHYYQLHTKFINKLKNKMFGAGFKEILWPYGVASKKSLFKRIYYKLNIMLVYYFRYKKEI